jgi:carboxypeptidase Taq
MTAKLDQLKARLAEPDDLDNAAAALEWDQLTMMPPGGADDRAHQYATLQKIGHELFTHPEVGRLLEDLAPDYRDAPAEDDDAAYIRVATRIFQRKTRIPAALVGEMSQATSLGQQVWAEARANSDFEAFRPHMERIFDLKRQVAACFPEAQSPYDALLDEYEPGATASHVREMFDELKRELVPLVRAIAEKPPVDDGVLRQHYPEERQWAVSAQVIQHFGYSFNNGRMDRAVHPFCTSLGLRDVRVTTRVLPNFLSSCLMGSMHECGHALYDLGYPDKYARTPLGHSASLGIHESQSRMWENLVGRSRGFWGWYYPQLQAAFPAQLGSVDLHTFYRAINKVRPTFVRVEADEVTYNLHTMLRFELELDLLEGRLEARHAPEAWNDKVGEYLGLEVTEDRLGVLQDTHWSSGLIGYFPTYTIGNLASVQLFDKAVSDTPTIPNDIAHGRFDTLLAWLRENVHKHGRKYLPSDLIQRATGKPLSAAAYINYLRTKYTDLYNLS